MTLSNLDFISDDILQAVAWIFTALSAVASIALTIHKFGLSPLKRALLLFGIILFGLALVVFLVPGSRWGLFDQPLIGGSGGSGGAAGGGGSTVVGGADLAAVREMIELIGADRVNGLLFHDNGRIEVVFATAPVRRGPNSQLYAVEFDEESGRGDGVRKAVAFSGTSFEGKIGNRMQNVEIVESGGGEVLVSTDDGIEMVVPGAGAERGGVSVEKLKL